MPEPVRRTIAIIGAGFSGLCLAIKLKQSGRHDFVILEKGATVGGTWRDNVYPGAECDVEAELYSFSFAPNDAWSSTYTKQPEILAYIRGCVKTYGLEPHIRFNQTVATVAFDADSNQNIVTLMTGETAAYDVVVSCVGLLHIPVTPEFPGASSFVGSAFHSARWDHNVDLRGKRVACIGSAGSAIQFIPEIAPLAAHLVVFQRSSNWVLPKGVRAFSAPERWLMARCSLYLLLRRWLWRFVRETLVFLVLRKSYSSGLRTCLEGLSLWFMRRSIHDAATQALMTPTYPLGAKRILISDTYYAALGRHNVSVVPSTIIGIEPSGIRTADGALHAADVLIYATGFALSSFLLPMDIIGIGGQSLQKRWAASQAQAYLGMTHTGHPNFFMMLGPNSSSGHSALVVMCEAQASYIVRCLDTLDAKRATTMEVKESAQTTFNVEMRERLATMIWADVPTSPYKDANGKLTTMWPGTMYEYEARTRRVHEDDYVFAQAPAA
ncbi:monooxygenase [Achlya hypogyna]|uniref:Monooxygenase n=1 Tax=Achlya hypogyna TaxID=1202772 RepID=A0A1V9ZPJ6_ACHHY|nr:monooxygenase [Achlya hypogyna]